MRVLPLPINKPIPRSSKQIDASKSGDIAMSQKKRTNEATLAGTGAIIGAESDIETSEEEPNTVIDRIEKDREFELLSPLRPGRKSFVLHSFSVLSAFKLLLSVNKPV